MIKNAFVNQITPTIVVTPLEKSDCMTCSVGCTKNQAQMEVINPDNLEIKQNGVVKIYISKVNQIIQGIVSILVPILLGILGYCLASPILSLFNKVATEGIKALFLLIFLFLSAIIILLLSKKLRKLSTPKIIEIVNF